MLVIVVVLPTADTSTADTSWVPPVAASGNASATPRRKPLSLLITLLQSVSAPPRARASVTKRAAAVCQGHDSTSHLVSCVRNLTEASQPLCYSCASDRQRASEDEDGRGR